MANTPRFRHVAPHEGRATWFGPTRMTIKATAADTGAYGLVEAWAPAGSATPWHVHHREDEAFWILEGHLFIRCGHAHCVAGPGSYVLLPFGVPHGFAVLGTRDARLLNIVQPGGAEALFVAGGRTPEHEGLPPVRSPEPQALQAMITHAATFDIEILGPPVQPSELHADDVMLRRAG